MKGRGIGAVVLVVGVLLCAAVYYWQKTRMYASVEYSDRSIRGKIEAEQLIGATPARVTAFLVREGIEHSPYAKEEYLMPEYSRTIRARVSNVGSGFDGAAPLDWVVLIRFKFDRNHRLESYDVEPVATGL